MNKISRELYIKIQAAKELGIRVYNDGEYFYWLQRGVVYRADYIDFIHDIWTPMEVDV